MKKTAEICVLILSILTVLLYSGCGDDKAGETFTDPAAKSGFVGNYAFSVESFSYMQTIETTGKQVEKTGYKVVKTNKETGERTPICVDPLCTHEIGSGCPAVSSDKLTFYGMVGDWALIMRGGYGIEVKENSYSPVSQCEYYVYNIVSGKLQTIKQAKGMQITGGKSAVFNGKVYFILPDLADGETVFKLCEYLPQSDSIKDIASYQKEYCIRAVTDRRIYLYELPYTSEKASDECDSFSVDYNGENRREEPEFNFTPEIIEGSVCYGSAYVDADDVYSAGMIVFGGYYYKYDLNTRKKIGIPAEDGATLLVKWNDKLVYATCRDVEKAVTANVYSYCEEHGLTVSEYFDGGHDKILAQTVNEIMFGDRMYIKTCDLNGENPEVLYEYPGMFFSSGKLIGNTLFVGCEEGEASGTRQMAIDLLTGEITAG